MDSETVARQGVSECALAPLRRERRHRNPWARYRLVPRPHRDRGYALYRRYALYKPGWLKMQLWQVKSFRETRSRLVAPERCSSSPRRRAASLARWRPLLATPDANSPRRLLRPVARPPSPRSSPGSSTRRCTPDAPHFARHRICAASCALRWTKRSPRCHHRVALQI